MTEQDREELRQKMGDERLQKAEEFAERCVPEDRKLTKEEFELMCRLHEL